MRDGTKREKARQAGLARLAEDCELDGASMPPPVLEEAIKEYALLLRCYLISKLLVKFLSSFFHEFSHPSTFLYTYSPW